MKTAHAVIGSNYGDEGKGRNVDAIVRGLPPGSVVVRSNGGAQAGHTVTTASGDRHVFHHFGSGALAGASTHLSRFFVHHPMSFTDERRTLGRFGAVTEISADPRGYVTTPFDMMVNHVLEISRGGDRHGSCGYGLGETMGRNEDTAFGLTFADLSHSGLRDRLVAIRDVWLPSRFDRLGILPDVGASEIIASPGLLDHFLDDCADFVSSVRLRDDRDLGGDAVVFEAAQGLLLDQRSADFPHVTRSNTGIQNIAAIAVEAGIDEIVATYATRCYITRHGAGPMPDERSMEEWFDVVDETNVPNPWQNAIRYGILDVHALARSIAADISKAEGVRIVTKVAVSCLDQARGDVPLFVDGRIVHVHPDHVPALLARHVGASHAKGWWSPSSDGSDMPVPLAQAA